MTNVSDAIVIGSGASGTAIAFSLTRAGIRRVTLFEKGPLVSGMTRRNAGLVHTALSNPTLVELAKLSLTAFRQWSLYQGGKSPYVETGLVLIASTRQGADRLRGLAAMMDKAGGDAQLIEPSLLNELFPFAEFDETGGAVFTRDAGYADAVQTAQAFAALAKDAGARVATGTLVKAILTEGKRVTGVVTTTGKYEAPIVVVAAGGWSERLLQPLGISLGLNFSRSAIAFFEQPADFRSDFPTFMDEESGAYLRSHSFHLFAAASSSTSTRTNSVDGFEDFVTSSESNALAGGAAKRIPALAGAAQKRSHAIAYDAPTDELPVIGSVPGFQGLYIAAGFGKDAFTLAPGVGETLAQVIRDGKSQVDISVLGPGRSSLRRRVS